MTTSVSAPPLAPAVIAIEESPPIEKFKFDGFFQGKIAALVLRDNTFMQRVDGLIRPEYFENQAEGVLVNIGITYFKKYKKVPADMSIYSTLIREMIGAKTMRAEVAKASVAHLRDLFKLDISDREYVIDQVGVFARHQAVADAMYKAIKKLDVKDFESIAKLMKTALDVGAHVDTGAYDFSGEIDRRAEERLDRAAGKLPPTGITTGYAPMDAVLYQKGWGRRELSILLGGAKSGKTTALIDFGVNAWVHGYNVCYVTLEVSAKIVAERMDANISEQAMMDLGANLHAVRAKVQAVADKARTVNGDGAKFMIHEFPTGSLTVTDLRRLVERYKGRGIKFDLLIVDYADLMAPERYTDNAIENSKSVYVNLRGLAMQEDIAVLSATQTNREGFKASVAKAEHVSDDFNKIRIADIVISLNRTEEEKAAKQARLFFAACRNQASNFSIRVDQDIDRMKFIKKIVAIE